MWSVFVSRRRVASVFLFFCRNVNMKSIIEIIRKYRRLDTMCVRIIVILQYI